MKLNIILLLTLTINVYAQVLIPKETSQLLVVQSENFETNTAQMQAYEKISNKWKKHGSKIKVNLGRNGLAWGKGIIDFSHDKTEAVKQEGDGKAPAGLFNLDSFFGYSSHKFNYPYKQVNENTLCVDDSSSLFYNKMIQAPDKKQYKSFEYMKRKDTLYKLGIVVSHNKLGVKQAGSCIFIHIQKSENAPTAGCTSMEENRLLEIMNWLDKSKIPLLLQVPTLYMPKEFTYK